MCLCTGTSGPGSTARTGSETDGRRHGFAVWVLLFAALTVNLAASVAYIAF